MGILQNLSDRPLEGVAVSVLTAEAQRAEGFQFSERAVWAPSKWIPKRQNPDHPLYAPRAELASPQERTTIPPGSSETFRTTAPVVHLPAEIRVTADGVGEVEVVEQLLPPH